MKKKHRQKNNNQFIILWKYTIEPYNSYRQKA